MKKENEVSEKERERERESFIRRDRVA